MDVAAWLRRHRWRLVRILPVAVVGLAFVALLARNADVPAFPDYEVPEGFVPSPPPSTVVPGGELPILVADVRGTTSTTVPPNVGSARVSGYVAGPAGAVPGAIVRLERVVGEATQVVDVVTGPDGRYEAVGIGGGRYRVRAFLPPSLAQPTGEVLYLRHDEDRTLDLTVESFDGAAISLAVAPDPALVGDPVNLAVRVSGSVVDADGVVRTEPLVGASVQVVVSGGWSPPLPSVTTTGADGQARFTTTCRAAASTQVQVSVRVPTAVPGTPPTTRTFDVAACVDPASLTTTTTTTTPDPSTTTSTTTG